MDQLMSELVWNKAKRISNAHISLWSVLLTVNLPNYVGHL